MSVEEAIACQFVFTKQELKKAMGCYWRYSPMIWWYLCVFLLLAALPFLFPGAAHPDLRGGGTEGSFSVISIVQNLIPATVVCCFVAGLVMYQTRTSFRRGPYFNQEMTYGFYDNGIQLKTPRIQTNMSWEVFTRAIENQNGFILFNMGKRSFNWFPKSGFNSPESIDRCRELLRRNVKDVRRLFPA